MQLLPVTTCLGGHIWNKLPERIFHPNETCDYWLITQNKQTIYIKFSTFKLQAIINQRPEN